MPSYAIFTRKLCSLAIARNFVASARPCIAMISVPQWVKAAGHLPSFAACINRAGRSFQNAPRMIGVRMGDQDRVGVEFRQTSAPILPAIDHHSSAAARNH